MSLGAHRVLQRRGVDVVEHGQGFLWGDAEFLEAFLQLFDPVEFVFQGLQPFVAGQAQLVRQGASVVRRHCLDASRMRYSARDVNMRYGSSVPLVTRSSIRTPMYAWLRLNVMGSLFHVERAALMPAMSPWHAASS